MRFSRFAVSNLQPCLRQLALALALSMLPPPATARAAQVETAHPPLMTGPASPESSPIDAPDGNADGSQHGEGDQTAPTAAELAELAAAIAAQAPAAAPADMLASTGMVGTGGGLMNPDISAIADVAVAAYNHDPKATGEHDPAMSGFTLQQLELHLGANVDPFFRLDGNIVYQPSGVELEEAFATTLRLPWNLQARAGQFLTRFGRQNSVHPHQWFFADQPLILGKFFGPDGSRGVGVEVSYLVPLPWFAELMVAAQGLPGDCCARSYAAGELGTDGGHAHDADAGNDDTPVAQMRAAAMMSTLAIKQFFPLHDDLSLLWGLSAQTATQAQGGRGLIAGSDIYLRWRPLKSDRRRSLSLQAEGMWRRRAAASAALDGGAVADGLYDFGGYAQLVWGIGAQWEAGVRAEAVSGLAHDPIDAAWTQVRRRYALQASFYPTHFSRLRGQLLMGQAAWFGHTVYGAIATLEVVMGAHGAHAY